MYEMSNSGARNAYRKKEKVIGVFYFLLVFALCVITFIVIAKPFAGWKLDNGKFIYTMLILKNIAQVLLMVTVASTLVLSLKFYVYQYN